MKNDIRLETTTIASDKSTYHIDLFKHYENSFYIELTHVRHTSPEGKQTIQIRKSSINAIIEALQRYADKIPDKPNEPTPKIAKELIPKKESREQIEDKILDAYLNKNVRIDDLAMRFSKSADQIRIILKNKGAKVVRERKRKKPK